MSKVGDHAVVLGASMAGLLWARVLADAYRRVTIVERDRASDRVTGVRLAPLGGAEKSSPPTWSWTRPAAADGRPDPSAPSTRISAACTPPQHPTRS